MNINKYTEKAQEAILAAQQLADRDGHPEIQPEHLLLTLVEQKEGIVPEIVRKMNADPAALAAAVRAELDKLPRAQGGSQPGLSARLRQVTNAAEQEAERLKDEYVSTEHLFVAIASEGVAIAVGETAPAARDHARTPSCRRWPRCAGRSASRARIPRAPTSRSSATGATSPSSRARASSIRSSAATRRSAA